MHNLPPIILASASPRRADILRDAGFEFQVLTSPVSETYPAGMNPESVPAFLAEKKAVAVGTDSQRGKIIIAADTIVLLDEVIMGKPRDKEHASEMLGSLSGRVHSVITGCCVLYEQQKHIFTNTTTVEFDVLSAGEIDFYTQNFKPFDKAGAYAIQEWIGMNRIKSITGCYYNVVGLPMNQLYQTLMQISPQN